MIYRITVINGRKYATAVKSREEFLVLRDSAENLANLAKARQGDEAAKRNLVQFAYNLGHVDGLIAGCKSIGSFFFHDIDCYDMSDGGSKMADVILSKKDEIGLMMLERSASGGWHLVCKRVPGTSILEAQVKNSTILQIEMDTNTHDLQRVVYSTSGSAEDLIYLDEELFDEPMSAEECEAEYARLKERERNGEEQLPPGAKKANKHYKPWEEDFNFQERRCRDKGQGPVTFCDRYQSPVTMNACLKFWIDEADIDGYRCDYISSPKIPASYWQTTIPMIKSYKAITFLGEADIASDATRLKDVGFDYDYAWQFQSSLANYGTGNTSARLKAFINTLLDKSASLSFGRMLYVTNHDQNFNESKKTLTQKYGDNRYPLTVLAYTIYGMPLIYNGQETGGNQALDYFNDTKINWNTNDPKMLNTLRTLFALKHAVPAISDAQQSSDNPTTTLLNVSGSNGVLAYTRTLGDSQVLVVLNMGTSAATATIEGITAGDWSLWLDSETIAQGTSRKQASLNATHTFSLESKGYRVYVSGIYPEQDVNQPTAIRSIESSSHNNDRWYTLTGQLIPRPTKRGLYIHNGRKVVVR